MILKEFIALLERTPPTWKEAPVNFWGGDDLARPTGIPTLRFVSDDLGTLRFAEDSDPHHIQSVSIIINLELV